MCPRSSGTASKRRPSPWRLICRRTCLASKFEASCNCERSRSSKSASQNQSECLSVCIANESRKQSRANTHPKHDKNQSQLFCFFFFVASRVHTCICLCTRACAHVHLSSTASTFPERASPAFSSVRRIVCFSRPNWRARQGPGACTAAVVAAGGGAGGADGVSVLGCCLFCGCYCVCSCVAHLLPASSWYVASHLPIHTIPLPSPPPSSPTCRAKHSPDPQRK